jgi:TolB-like protein/class 3 adenylate cyclase/Tfp pilus assembly protein PilF
MTSLIELNQTLNRGTKVLLVMDVVESVRLMEADEDGFVQRWQQLVQQAEQRILPLHGGRIVKSLGDGLMLEFADAAGCVKAAFDLQTFSRLANQGFAADRQMHLRMGGHVAKFVTDKHDIYGTDVNLTARFATLAGPGDVVISAELRDCIPAGLDADIEDLGECHLKHLSVPLQVYRAWPVHDLERVPAPQATAPDFRPTVAVIPFEARSNEPEHFVIGELLADGIIAQLSRSADLRVISRLSTTALRGRAGGVSEAESRLAATFVLSGSYIASGSKILIMAELAEAHSSQVIWADRLSGDTMDLLQAQSELVNRIAAAASTALIDSEVQQSLAQPLPRLDSGALLLGGIALMHRSSLRDFDRSRAVLEALLERHNRAATPRAWLAKWYTMRVIRGMSTEPGKDTQLALEQTRRALDLSPDNALSLAIEGYTRCQLLGEADAAHDCIEHAIELNPNEPLGWLYKSVWSSMWGESASAVIEAEHAAQLSPIDPLKYFFDVILASSHVLNGNFDGAMEFARRSLRSNRNHQPALRVLLLAQAESGKLAEAHDTLNILLAEVPNLTISTYLSMGSAGSSARQRLASALRQLGVAES